MNIFEVGVDIVENERILKKIKNNDRFIYRVLTKNELQMYFDSKSEKRKIEIIAGRFAAKEAIYKCLSEIFRIGFQDVEILQLNNFRKPVVNILNEKLREIFKLKKIKILLSISHSDTNTIAYSNLVSCN